MGACVTPDDAASLRRLVEREPFAAGAHIHEWTHGGVGLACAWRHGRAAFDSGPGVQVAFDGRLDDRDGLRVALRGEGLDPAADTSDAALVAHAYTSWGMACLERLLGEFAFCVWDQSRATLVTARDRFGVKPLFYAAVPDGWAVASSLAALRQWPGAPARLADDAIGDFLLFGESQDPRGTCFAGIARVPPGSWVQFTQGQGPRTGSYFSLSVAEPLRYRNPGDYVEHFRDLFHTAVKERLEQQVAFMMSGGLDSSSVAAMAVGPEGAEAGRCVALTAVYDTLFDDEERRFSSATAKALGLSIEHVPVDGYELFARWDADAGPPEPSTEVLSAIMRDLTLRAGRHADVALTGDGGDPSLLPGAVVRNIGRLPPVELVRGMWRTLRRGLWPPLGVRSGVLRKIAGSSTAPPSWLSARLRRVYDPVGRWVSYQRRLAPLHEPRGESLAVLARPGWDRSFESADPNTTGLPVELRYPFFDARLMAFALSLPSYPWCVNKTILRDAMVGRLPDEIRLRPKTALAGDPLAVRAWPATRLVALLRTTPGIAEYIDLDAFERAAHDSGLLTDRQPGTLAAAALATWLNTPAGRTAYV